MLAVAGRALARRPRDRDGPGEVAVARVLSRSGTWVVLHGAPLVDGAAGAGRGDRRARPPGRISPLLMSAYGLTEREQEVTRLVLQGDSTAEIAERLVVSAHTVQQHLKSIFDKTGVRSRRDLVGKVFFAHYEPRVRDNEDASPPTGRSAAGRCRPGLDHDLLAQRHQAERDQLEVGDDAKDPGMSGNGLSGLLLVVI